MSRYLRLNEVLAKLSCGADTFDRVYRFAGGFPPELHGKRWSDAAIDEWMQAHPVSRKVRRRSLCSNAKVSSSPGARSSGQAP